MQHPEHPKPRRPSRREVIALGIGALAVAAVPFTRRRHKLVRRTVPVMGTLAEVGVVHGDEIYAQRAIDAAIEDIISYLYLFCPTVINQICLSRYGRNTYR